MNLQEELPADTFQRAVAAAMRAVAGDKELTVSFGHEAPGLSGNRARLPLPSRAAIGRIRGTADAYALKRRHHDEELHAMMSPRAGAARTVFDAIEQIRVETVGARRMKGVARNLRLRLEALCGVRGYARMLHKDETPLADAIGLLVRERLTGERLPEEAARVADLWRAEIEARGGAHLRELCRQVEDQRLFAHAGQALARELGLCDDAASDPVGDDEDEESGLQQDHLRASDIEQAGLADVDEDARDLGALASETDGRDDREEDKWHRRPGKDDRCDQPYVVFAPEFDEEIVAADLCDAAELTRLRRYLDQQSKHRQGIVARLANRLQRRLMTQRDRRWVFDLEEGVLDASHLDRVIADPMLSLLYKQEQEIKLRDTVVTLLLDNSGSMRGGPIRETALCADIIARTLERCAVKTEILGFTTGAWEGGRARRKWLAEGMPRNPGRLNDLRHIIYKKADEPWRRARRNLGVMLREGLLKENIDGEALLWAHRRLLARPEQRRILMVISDGAPDDKSTLSVNSANYLDRHLKEVIRAIETHSPVQLIAIGAGHDVTRYYPHAVNIVDAEELGGVMMDELLDLFEDQTCAQRKRRGYVSR